MLRFGSFGAWSILAAPRLVLSPYPSPSVSRYCERSEGNASCEFAHPSESESGHPVRPLCDDPAWLGQSSLKLPEALSPNPSESVSLHCEGSDGQTSAPIATVQAPTGSAASVTIGIDTTESVTGGIPSSTRTFIPLVAGDVVPEPIPVGIRGLCGVIGQIVTIV